jgi:hypothetical protein
MKHIKLCHCPGCRGVQEHFVSGVQPRYNPTVSTAAIEPENASDRSVDLNAERRPTVTHHAHVKRPIAEY